MKRIIALFLSLLLVFIGISELLYADSELSGEDIEEITAGSPDDSTILTFHDLADPILLQYIEDTVYTGLVDEFQSEDYIIEEINTSYISKEYLEEVAYNSQTNIWFGYTLEELNKRFSEEKYVFTLNENGETIVTPFQDYDNTFEKVIQNVAIGTGVIVICITVSVVTGGAGAIPVSMVFAASAKTASIFALSSGTISAVTAGTITGIQTKDLEKAVKAAALKGSEGFKWGAIAGAISGGISEIQALHNAAETGGQVIYAGEEAGKAAPSITDTIPRWRQAELRALKQYPGKEQVSFLDGKTVEFATPGATRPDIIRTVGDHLEAIEVKCYDLSNSGCMSTLRRELEREISSRIVNLPPGSTQRIILDVTDRNFSNEVINSAINSIRQGLNGYYPNIPIDIVGI